MRSWVALFFLIVILVLGAAVFAQNSPKGVPQSVTVPLTLDQGRVVIDVDILLPDGSTERVRGWVDNGTPDLCMSRRVADLIGLSVRCDGQVCSGTPKSLAVSAGIAIGGMKIPLSIREARVSVRSPALAPGMSAEINLPSSLLRGYDVLINFPAREFSIGLPGTLKFNGVKSKMLVNPSNGLIQIPSKIENKSCDLSLDLGSSINFLAEDLFDKLSNSHRDWPHMTGAVGPFNTGGRGDETTWKLMRVDRVQFGPLFLTDVAVVDLPAEIGKDRTDHFEARPGFSTTGLLSAEALLNYRVGLDYAHATVFFDIGRTVRFPDFDVVGLILRPEIDRVFTIVALADYAGNSVPEVQAGDHLVAVDDNPVADFTLGEVWSLLEGSPGQERRLTIARAGKQFTVVAKVQHFLGDVPGISDTRGKSKKN